jgi:hypothetical protein
MNRDKAPRHFSEAIVKKEIVVVTVCIGLAAAFTVMRLLQSLHYGVSARDPLIYIVVPVADLVVAWPPA